MADITKTLNTRIGLKIDTLENWNKSTLGLLKGEIAIATVAATAGSGLSEPVCMIKIGEDGVKTFSQLEWNFYAKSSDVLAACKSEDSLKTFINTVIADSKLASSERVTAVENAITTLNGDENTAGSVAKSIKDAIDALKLAETYVAQEDGKSLIADTEITRLAGMSDGANKVEASTNGNIKIDGVDTVVYTHPEKHAIDDVDGLQAALDGKQAAGDYAAEIHTHTASEITDFATEVAKVKVTNAGMADEATKATQDGAGNVIVDTYAKKIDVYTKDEANAEFTTEAEVKTIAANEINTLIGGVSDTDTIENITTLVNYVNEHGADTSALVSEVYGASETTGTSRIDTLEGEIDVLTGDGEGSITKEITDAIAAENLSQYAKTADLGTMATETAIDYVKKSEANGYNDILTKTEAKNAYQAKGEYYTKTEADEAFTDSTEVDNQIDVKINTLVNEGQVKTNTDAIAAINNETTGILAQAKAYADTLNHEDTKYTAAVDGGLKLDDNNAFSIDDSITFIFNCGDSGATA